MFISTCAHYSLLGDGYDIFYGISVAPGYSILQKSKSFVYREKFAGKLKNDIQNKYNNFKDFTKSYNLNDRRKDNFFSWLEAQEVEFKAEELEENWDYIQNRILSEAASSIWGKQYLFKKLLEADKQAQEALKHFEEARMLINSG